MFKLAKAMSVRSVSERSQSIRKSSAGSFVLKDRGFSDTDGVDGRKHKRTNRFVNAKLETEYMMHIEKAVTGHIYTTIQVIMSFCSVIAIFYVLLGQMVNFVLALAEIIFMSPVRYHPPLPPLLLPSPQL
jgi:hypothetical protein